MFYAGSIPAIFLIPIPRHRLPDRPLDESVNTYSIKLSCMILDGLLIFLGNSKIEGKNKIGKFFKEFFKKVLTYFIKYDIIYTEKEERCKT